MAVRGRRGLVPAVVSCLLVVVSAAPAPAAPGDAVGLDEVLAGLGVDRAPTDYAVLVDKSGSMRDDGRYDRVKQVLGEFAGSLRPEDRVRLFAFDSAVSPVYDGEASGAAGAVERMPAQPGGGSTDIGAAISGAVDALSGSAGPGGRAIVLLTDGEHAPPAGSPFRDVGSPAWTDLRQRADRLTGLRGYAFPLTNDVSGAELLLDVVPRTEVPRLTGDALVDYLNGVADRVRRGIAADALAPDLAAGVDVRWAGAPPDLDLSGDDVPVTAELVSTATALPLVVTGARVVSELGEVTGLPDRVELGPGQARRLDLVLHPREVGGFELGLTREPAAADLRLTGELDSPWRQVVEGDLALPLDLRPVSGATTWSGTREHGISWNWVIALVVLVLLGLLLSARRWLTGNPRLVGALVADPPEGAPVRVELRGRRVVRLDRGRTRRALGLTGRCEVRGEADRHGGAPALHVTYERAGRDALTGRCRPGEFLELGGMRFWYLVDEHDVPLIEDQPATPTRR
ncbi:vWA domain-containing protein [Saccharothrix xinjiangensis]|uniref:VWA domain-containing protein n=1 Tax=Saccharothrix xinjiangensis TaxID=204798 RepID=A0ABV9Y9D4_9PSEU